MGDYVEFAGGVNLAAGMIRGAAGISTDMNSNTVTGLSYSTWKFDSSTTFTWCSNADGTNPFSCQITGFKVWYTYPVYYGLCLLGGTTGNSTYELTI